MTALSRAFAATGTRETLHGDDWRAELADASVCSMLRLCGRKDARSSVDIRWLLVAFHRSSAEHVTNDRSRLWSRRRGEKAHERGTRLASSAYSDSRFPRSPQQSPSQRRDRKMRCGQSLEHRPCRELAVP